MKLVDGKNDAATFLPLTIKDGSYISSKSEGNNDKSSKLPKYKPARFVTEDKAKIISNKENARHDVHSHTTQKEMIKDLDINPYKDVILKESDRKRDLVPIRGHSKA